MSNWCEEPSGPYRVTIRGAHATVFDNRADLFACLDAMTPEMRRDALVENPCLGIVDRNPGDYVRDALKAECSYVVEA